MEVIHVNSAKKEELIDITREVQICLKKSGVKQGLCCIFTPHTTAGITINENADPDVKDDIVKGLKFVSPQGFKHIEGNSPAHIKASLIGASEILPIEKGSLQLGIWQGIYFAEFDGPRNRKVYVKFI